MINHMDNIKLLSHDEKELENLILELWIYKQEVGMEFGIEHVSW